MNKLFTALKQKLFNKDASAIISELYNLLDNDRIVLASSLSIEDQVLTHMVCSVSKKPRIFTLDTGRLFQETYDTMEKTMNRYGFRYEIVVPDSKELESIVSKYGPNLFYQSVELRKLCCKVRKVNPLKRILVTADVWICGLRREQSQTRTDIQPIEWDDTNGIVKINPIFDWTENEVWAFIRKYEIPYNPLQYKGFRSIGCLPCTRAIGQSDNIRDGRWWWESPEHKECGLHKR
jgi:phosphoadenosine phosphosulfate reductase